MKEKVNNKRGNETDNEYYERTRKEIRDKVNAE